MFPSDRKRDLWGLELSEEEGLAEKWGGFLSLISARVLGLQQGSGACMPVCCMPCFGAPQKFVEKKKDVDSDSSSDETVAASRGRAHALQGWPWTTSLGSSVKVHPGEWLCGPDTGQGCGDIYILHCLLEMFIKKCGAMSRTLTSRSSR